MLGHARLFRRPQAARLEEPVAIGAKLMHFLRAVTRVGADGQLTVRLTGPQGSGILTSMSQANALLVIPGLVETRRPRQALLLTTRSTRRSPF
jgi:molybdopterin molybdotransferase